MTNSRYRRLMQEWESLQRCRALTLASLRDINEQLEDIMPELRDPPLAEFTRQLGGTISEPGAFGRTIQRYLDEVVAADLTIRHDLSAYQAFADTASASAIAGDLLTFAKGRWRSGEEKAPVPPEARFLVNMDEMWTGWVRWFNKKPVEHRISRVGDPVPARADLGHRRCGAEV